MIFINKKKDNLHMENVRQIVEQLIIDIDLVVQPKPSHKPMY